MRKIILFCFFITIVKTKAQNIVSTYAGTTTPAFTNGDTATARFKLPFGICMDKLGNLYVADGGNNCIRKITSTGTVTTLAGTGTAGYLDGAASSAMFNNPTGVCVDDSFNVYVADFQNQRIRKISFSGTVTTIAGSGTAGYLDGVPTLAQFNYPRGICRNKLGELFVGDSWNHRIRKIALNGTVSTYAGGGSTIGVSSVGSLVNAKDTAARFYTPCGVDVDKNNNVYVADAYNHRIRMIDPLQNVSVIAGSGSTGVGNGGYANGAAITSASLNVPTEVSCDSTGTKIYIGDTFSSHVRFLFGGSLSNLAGSGTQGYLNGLDAVAQFNYTRGVVSNPQGTKIYVVDYNNNCIRKINMASPTGIVENNGQESAPILFPNPNKGKFNVLSKGNSLLRIIDMNSKLIIEKEFCNSIELELSNLNSGLYSIIISGDNSSKIIRFVRD